MIGNPKNYNQVYFLNEAHKHSFQKLFKKFTCCSREYTSTCYLAACPEIFKCFDLELQENGRLVFCLSG